MNGVLSMQAMLKSYKEDSWGNQVSSVQESEEKSQRQLRDSWKGATI
jgi:hypothetical protein